MLGPTTAGVRPTAASCFGHAVGRAAHARRATVQDMGVNLRGGHVPVPEQLLDSPDVVVLLQKIVAKEWRNVWGVPRLAMPAFLTADFTTRCSTDSCRWCRRRWRVSRWK